VGRLSCRIRRWFRPRSGTRRWWHASATARSAFAESSRPQPTSLRTAQERNDARTPSPASPAAAGSLPRRDAAFVVDACTGWTRSLLILRITASHTISSFQFEQSNPADRVGCACSLAICGGRAIYPRARVGPTAYVHCLRLNRSAVRRWAVPAAQPREPHVSHVAGCACEAESQGPPMHTRALDHVGDTGPTPTSHDS
jgi:hypothetical protein